MGNTGGNLSVKPPDWKVEVGGPNLYQDTVLILRESGPYSMGRKIDSRGATDGGCGSLTGNGNGGWKTEHINDWLLTLKVGGMSHVIVSHFEIFGILAEISRGKEGGAKLRIGTSGTHSATNLTRSTSGEIVGKLEPNS